MSDEPASGPPGLVAPRVRVRYPETDRMNVAHHMHFLAWMEIGRTEWMRAAGVPYERVESELGLRFPVHELGVKYVTPARYDDVLEVRTRVAAVNRLRVRFDYEIVRGTDGDRVATGETMHVCTREDGRPARMPRDLAVRLGAAR